MTSKAVNVPTDTKVKEKDVNAKLQLYGIYAAFAQGKVPSNKQIDVAMNTALQWNGLSQPNKKLSAEGQQLVADLRDVIEKTKLMLLTKNHGNLIQDFIWQTQSIQTDHVSNPNLPVDKETARQHGNEAVEGLRTLGQLLITNGQFRKLLNDATILIRDIAGDAATKAAGKVNPSDEQLRQIDEPAEDNTWHEQPDFQGMKQNLRNQFPSKQGVKEDASAAVGDATQAAHPQGSRDPADVATREAEARRQGVDSTTDPKTGAKTGARNMKENFAGRFDEDQKQRYREYRERTANYFKEKVPKERRDQVIWRLKKMIVEIQTHQDYQQAIDTLLRLAEEYTGHSKNLAGQTQDTAKGGYQQGGVKSAEADLKELLERFANGTSFDDLIDSINQIYRDADQDPELKQWFRDLDKFIRRALQEQGYIIEEQSNQDWNAIYDKGHFLLRERYRNHTDRIVDETKFLANQFDEDPENKAFARSMDKLFKDLGNDQDGKPTFKPHLVKDLTEVLIPAFFENVRYVPIPRIEFSDNMIDAVVENLVLEGDNLAPNMLEFGSDNYWRWGRKGMQSKNKNKVLLSVSGIQMDLRDVAYYVKKKEGFPGITDKGVMDIFLGGSGVSFKVAMETADPTDRQHFFKINTVNVQIQNMNIKVKQSNHKLLFNLFKPLLFKVMRPVLQKVIEKQVRDNVTAADAFLYRVKLEADRAAEQAKAANDPDQVANIYQRYFNSFQRELQKGKEKKERAKEKVADKQVNVAMTQHDSMFKNISLPGGISTKATEYKTLADKGDRWESPVFSIGSARESSLPAPSKPTRKPHSSTPLEVRTDPNRGVHSGTDHAGTGPLSSSTGNYGANTGGLNTGGISSTGGLGATNGNLGSTTGSGNLGSATGTSNFGGPAGTTYRDY